MGKLLRLASIEKSYNITRTHKQTVLKGLDVEFDRGEFVALVGESGCRKSTLMNIIGGLDTEYTGSVVVKDQFLRDFTKSILNRNRAFLALFFVFIMNEICYYIFRRYYK